LKHGAYGIGNRCTCLEHQLARCSDPNTTLARTLPGLATSKSHPVAGR
jgi:hypothetical protein